MFISNIEISGYRNLRQVGIPLDSVTVIVGENNSGKSNVLDAISAGLRVNRTVKQGAFDVHDYHLASATSMAGDVGPISITITFQEQRENEWPQAIANAMQEVVTFHETEPLRKITLQVKSTPASAKHEEKYEWSFLDANGKPYSSKHFAALNRLQALRPFYLLNAVRDASREFSKRSQFFGAFINDPTFDDATKDSLVHALASINTTVLASHESFTILKDSLDTGNSVVRAEAGQTAEIEAVPSRITDLLENTQVSFSDRAGVKMPVSRQGSGTQSLAVLSLFRAFVASKIKAQLEPLSEPILAIEEPECHLHPAAVRSLWSLISNLPGQRIVTTHSGDLVSEVPLSSLRRLAVNDKNEVCCYKPNPKHFSSDELRLLNYNVRRTRGELFFASKWLLVEGKTESTALPEFATVLERDFRQRGIRLIEYASHGGPGPYIRLADDLGIQWHCLSDGDSAGEAYKATAEAELRGRNAQDHITTLDPGLAFEAYMCKYGFNEVYGAHQSVQKQALIVATHGTDEYWTQYGEAVIGTHKEIAVLEVCARVAEGAVPIPPLLKELIMRVT